MNRLTRLSLHATFAATILAISGVGIGTARAQSPGGAPGGAQPVKLHNKNYFRLPIIIKPAERAKVDKVILFVKQPTTKWQNAQVVDGSKQFFVYRVPNDGEFWFSVVTVDKFGRANPPDVRREPPALRVVVDTQPPTVQMELITLPGNRGAVRCRVSDRNLNPQGMRLMYYGANQQTVPMQLMPGSNDIYAIPGVGPIQGLVRCTATDAAKNTVTKTLPVQIAGKVVQAPPPLPPQGLQQIGGTKKTPLPAAPPKPRETLRPSIPNNPPINPMPLPKIKPSPALPNQKNPPNVSPLPAAPGTANGANSGDLGNRHIIRSLRARLDYRIDKKGPSGVRKVDVWLKGAQGAWQFLASDPDVSSPAEINLPGEGLFGVRLAVTNGNGFGGERPTSADQPDYWIEVDQTPPLVQLHQVEPVVSGGAVELRWTVSDKNLTDSPISLHYAAQRGGPWYPIARNLKNTSRYQWNFPRNAGSQFYLRVTATDRAGNQASFESQSPIVLDMTVPRASVVGVTPLAASGR